MLKKQKNLLFIAVVGSFLISSCAEMKITTKIPFIKSESIKKIALTQVMIGVPQKKYFPLIDAGIFNSKMNKISDEIFDLQSSKVNAYNESIAQKMKAKFGCEVLSGKELIESPNFAKTKENMNNAKAMLTEDDNYPIVNMATGQFNAYSFAKGDVDHFIFENAGYKSISIDLCKQLEVDAVVLSFTRFKIIDVKIFGSSAVSRLYTTFLIYYKDGRKIGEAEAYSKIHYVTGKDIIEYKMVFDDFETIIEPLTTQITKSTDIN